MNNIENIIIEKFLDDRISLDKTVELLEAAEKKHVGPISQAKNQIKQFKQDMEETNKKIEDSEKRIKEEQEKFEKRSKQAKKIMKAMAIAGVGIAGLGTAAVIHNGRNTKPIDLEKAMKFNDEVDRRLDKVNLSDPESVEKFKKENKELRKKYGYE